MPHYTFQVRNAKTTCEMSDVALPDDDAARDYAIQFASELFRWHHEVCADEWHLCSVHVFTGSNDEVFSTTMPHAALLEREDMRLRRIQKVNH